MKESSRAHPRRGADAAASPGASAPGGEGVAAGGRPGDEVKEEGRVDETSTGPAVAPTAPPNEAPDYKDRWLRAEAELQNFRRRASREWDEGRRAAEEDVLLDMVAALDDLERALEAARTAGSAGPWIDGVALVAQRLRDGLSRRGVTVEDPLGQPFDPAFHEALQVVETADHPAGTVVSEYRRAYVLGERLVRTAQVVVARPPAADGPAAPAAPAEGSPAPEGD
jgi:molecular chaperone GrpE